MNILDMIKEGRDKKAFETANSEAVRIFLAQKEGVQAIKDTRGYKDIKEFFKQQKEIAIKRLISSQKDQPMARAMVELSDNYLKYIEAREG